MRTISESDWKLFKPLRELALARFCERALGELRTLMADSATPAPERFGAAYRLLQDRDRELQRTFDYLRRSTAFDQVVAFRLNDLVTDEELGPFSQEMRESLGSALQTLRS